MWGYIACQTDKTPEAVGALIDLTDNLPESPERFDEARQSRTNRYGTAKSVSEMSLVLYAHGNA